MQFENEECGKPCDPDENNDCCAEYWHRMALEGFWDLGKHAWTVKGMKEMSK